MPTLKKIKMQLSEKLKEKNRWDPVVKAYNHNI